MPACAIVYLRGMTGDDIRAISDGLRIHQARNAVGTALSLARPLNFPHGNQTSSIAPLAKHRAQRTALPRKTSQNSVINGVPGPF